jgi:hypothetical protein
MDFGQVQIRNPHNAPDHSGPFVTHLMGLLEGASKQVPDQKHELGSGKLASLFDPDMLELLEPFRKPLARIQIFEEMIEFSRLFISSRVATRLINLRSQAYDPAEEEPINPLSVRHFLEYCQRRGVRREPIITATATGHIQADWRENREKRFSLRFFSDGRVWFARREPMTRISGEVLLNVLLSRKSPIEIPEWT